VSRFKGKLVRVTAIVVGGVLALAVTTVALVAVLVGTEAGSRLATRYLLDYINGAEAFSLEANEIGGTLYSGLSLRGVSFVSEDVELEASSVSATWNPWALARGEYLIDDARLADLHLVIPETDATDSTEAESDQLDLPRIELPKIEIDGFTTTLDARLDSRRIAGSLILTGNVLSVTDLQIESQSGDLQGELELVFSDVLGLNLDAQWQLAETLFPDLPGLAGSTQLQGDLSSIEIHQSLQPPFNIVSMGAVSSLDDPDNLQFDLSHRVELAAIPQLPAEIRGVELTLQTRGSMEAIQLDAEGELELSSYPVHQLRFSGNYSGTQLALSSLRLRQEQTTLTANVILDWSESVDLTGSYSLEQLNPLDYISMETQSNWVPFNIHSNGVFVVEDIQDDLQASADIDTLNLLTEYSEVNGSGKVTWANNELDIDNFQLGQGSSQVLLDGTVGNENTLTWKIEIQDLGQFVTDAAGSIEGSGQLTGTQQSPFVIGTLSTSGITAGPLQVESVSAAIEGAPEEYTADVVIRGFELETDSVQESIRRAELGISGDLDHFDLTLDTQSDQGSIALTLEGGAFQGVPLRWQGNIVRANLNASREWQLLGAAPLSITAEQLVLGDSCLQSDGASLCFAYQAQLEQGQGSFTAALDAFPLAALTEINRIFPSGTLQNMPALQLPEGVSLSGNLDALVEGDIDPVSGNSLALSVRVPDPVMTLQMQNEVDSTDMGEAEALSRRDYHWSGVSLNGQLQNSSWDLLASGALVEQSINGQTSPLDGNIDLTLTVSATQNLQGTVQAGFSDLSWLELYSADLSNISGRLTTEFQVAGSVEQPLLNGFFAVEQGAFSLDRWGVRIEDFAATLTSTDSGTVTVNARAASQEGQLALDGIAENLLTADASLELKLSGSDFRLLDSPELSVVVTPDLNLIATESGINLNGSILLPHVLVVMENLPESAVNVSSDVVIVNYSSDTSGVVNSLAAENSRFLNIPISAGLTIELGDDVRFEGLGLTTSLAGQLDVELLENGSNRTFGELAITEGSYTLYGQRLEIDEGELLFIGPYHNPGLDVRATRTVEGQVVGVQMNGTLRNLRSELISTPSLPDAEVLALIATGRPLGSLGNSDEDALLGSIARLGLSRGRGISDRVRSGLGLDTLAITNTGNINNSLLTVGKYLSPNLFVRYGLGLFDSQSKVAVEYDLTETLKLQAESGEYQSLDLTYSIER
jgi:translocation and assembly module TamB